MYAGYAPILCKQIPYAIGEAPARPMYLMDRSDIPSLYALHRPIHDL